MSPGPRPGARGRRPLRRAGKPWGEPTLPAQESDRGRPDGGVAWRHGAGGAGGAVAGGRGARRALRRGVRLRGAVDRDLLPAVVPVAASTPAARDVLRAAGGGGAGG